MKLAEPVLGARHRQDSGRVSHAAPEYKQALSTVIHQAIQERDILALNGFIASRVVREAHFTREEITTFWQGGWRAWWQATQTEKKALEEFLAMINLENSWLSGTPVNPAVPEPEEV